MYLGVSEGAVLPETKWRNVRDHGRGDVRQRGVDGHIAIREYLCLTVSLDHDPIDGAPAARFVTRLKELIESGFGLLDQEIMAEQAST